LIFYNFYVIIWHMSADRRIVHLPDDGYRQDESLASVASSEDQCVAEMGIDKAKAVLRTIVATHESTFNAETPLDQIAEYSTADIRNALKVVARAIMDSENTTKSLLEASKLTSQGDLLLSMNDKSVRLKLIVAESPGVIDNNFALQEPHVTERYQYRFADMRSGVVRGASLSRAGNPNLDGFRQMIRGLRWMSANMLAWEKPDCILPEYFDNPELSQSPQGELPMAR
jgi:hypothetical protein